MTFVPPLPPQRVAIIGTGLAGLHAAHLLSETSTLRSRFDVHLFEKGEKLGLDGSSITVNEARIDVPLRSFNAGYYPSLMKLYKKLGIPIRKNNFTFSFSTSSNPGQPFLLYNGHSGLRGVSIPWQSFPQSTSPFDLFNYLGLLISFIASYFALIILSLYHYYCGHLNDPAHPLSTRPLQSWLEQHSMFLSPTFSDSILLSLFSAMTTSSHWKVKQIPTSEVMLYIATTFLRNHYTIQGGVQTAQDQLIRNIPPNNIHTEMAVQTLCKTTPSSSNEIDLFTKETENEEQKRFQGFHHIIFATPANLSASLLDSYRESLSTSKDDSSEEVDRITGIQTELKQVCYEESTVINHTDESLLPKNRSDWRDLNLVSPTALRAMNEGEERAMTSSKANTIHTMATHVCHQLDKNQFIFQTTNPIIMPHPSSIVSTSTFSRALTTSKSYQHKLFTWVKVGFFGQWKLQLGPLQGPPIVEQGNNTQSSPNLWFCGSYTQGIPLLEGCVTSSRLVVDQMIQD